MPLPKIATPTYELELPSTGQTIQYRPFLVKEEKLLVLALEGEDVKEITTAIKNVIKSCIQTKGIKVDTLPTFDIEYLFLNIRGKSVGEDLEVKLLCPDDNETYVPVKVLIDDIKVVKMINNILSSKIRPAIMQDGGDVKFIKYESGTVYLSLKGSCAGCPSATVTLKNGIENMLKHHIPEVKNVEQVV